MNDTPRESDPESERTQREYGELLEEIRVALPGVEVLFAFLLTPPFTERFDRLNGEQKLAYFFALLCVAAGCVLLMAPTAHHRLQFRAGDKPWITRCGTALVLLAMLCVAMGISVTLFVVSSMIFSRMVGIAVGASAGAVLLALWYGLPLARRISAR